MASLIDIFNPSFFVFLGILVLVVALLVVYFESKMREQNHKITSMFSLVSSMADELNLVKYSMTVLNNNNGQEEIKEQQEDLISRKPKLIEVSDDEDSVVSSSDEDSIDEYDEDNEEQENEIIEIGGSNNDIKVLNMSAFSLKNDIDDDDDIKNIVFDEIDEEDIVNNNNDVIEDESSSGSSSEDEDDEHLAEVKEPDFSFKSINISIEEDDNNNKSHDFDYKKLSIGRLRKIVQEKKLADDSSKLKKNELLKLLEV